MQTVGHKIGMDEALGDAIERAGGLSALAKAMNDVTDLPLPDSSPVSRSHVSTWNRRGACPPDRVLLMEAATKVTRHQLRPDVFGFEPIPLAQPEAAE